MTDSFGRLSSALADRYTIERELGRGGMAVVHLAHDIRHDRKVAIKVLRPELAAALGAERFHQEIKIAANLHHPHILPLYDSGEADGFLYFVMPYVEGQSLRDRLAKEGELPLAEAVRILRDVVGALKHAHKHNVIHRDIKPDNVMLAEDHALVTDFGVAKAVSEATGAIGLTTEGVALGTPAYMSPEQASADPHIDHRADIYAVGVIAYELLTGRTPFIGNTQQELLAAHVTQTPDPVTRYRESVPPALAQLVMKCLEKKAADRWQTAEELLPQLEALATPSGGVTPSGTRRIAGESTRRRWLFPTAAAVAVLVAIVVVAWRMVAASPITITTSNIRQVTREPGLEWQPALSPDGSQVAFVARRAGNQSVVIRSTLNIAGGGQLTPTQGLQESEEIFPAWSPDGEFVRFCGVRHVAAAWVDLAGAEFSECRWMETGRLGGSMRSLDLPSNVAFASWSPEGDRVAFIGLPDSLLTYSISERTTTTLALPREVVWALHSPVWSPDGRWIAYVNGNPSWPISFNVARSSIWIVDADVGEPLRVTGEDFMDISPAWLDENHLLFVSNRDGLREVYVVELGRTGPRGAPVKVPGVIDAHSVSYSIRGRKLAVSKAIVRQNIWSYPIGSGPVSIAAGSPVTSDNAVIEDHDISPDGKWIVFDSNLRGNMDIFKRPLEGGDPTPMTDTPSDDYHPRWSPDGTEIAFYTLVGEVDRAMMVVAADGGAPVQLARGSWLLGYPEWSPSGLDIAFRSSQTGRFEVWLSSRETIGGSWSEATQLTDFGCIPTDWAPDDNGVLCQAGEEMVLVSRDGGVRWRYDLSTVGLRGIMRPKFSRDGSTVYVYGMNEDGVEGIWAVPPLGGEPRLVIAYDDDDMAAGFFFSVGRDHLYVTVPEHESDIWVMDVEVER